jgi:hypothetical protein
MVGSLAACCARTASGQVTAARPTSVMNSRRLMAAPEAQDRVSYQPAPVVWKGPGVPQPLSALGH